MKCCECRFWGEDGNGTGVPYDAGHMNYCMHNQINGEQHPSYGSCGEPVTMIYMNAEAPRYQHVMTRRNFGCVLFKEIDK